MKLYEFEATTTEDGERIVRVAARIADHQDEDEQTQWINFQIGIDMPTVRNGALQRSEALDTVTAILRELSVHFERIGRQR